jgi:hypothetical protein
MHTFLRRAFVPAMAALLPATASAHGRGATATTATLATLAPRRTAYHLVAPDGASGATPEPASVLLMGTGAAALALAAYHRRRA